MFTEAQTGRGRLDTHFYIVNHVLKSFVEDGNDVIVEKTSLKHWDFVVALQGQQVYCWIVKDFQKGS